MPVDQVENLQVVRQVVKPVVEYVDKKVPKAWSGGWVSCYVLSYGTSKVFGPRPITKPNQFGNDLG